MIFRYPVLSIGIFYVLVISIAIVLAQNGSASSNTKFNVTNVNSVYQAPVISSQNDTGYIAMTSVRNKTFNNILNNIAKGIVSQLQKELFNASSLLYDDVYARSLQDIPDLKATPDLNSILQYFSGNYDLVMDIAGKCILSQAPIVRTLQESISRKISGPLNITNNGTFLNFELTSVNCLASFTNTRSSATLMKRRSNMTGESFYKRSAIFAQKPHRLQRRFFWLIIEFLINLFLRLIPQLLTAIIRVAGTVLAEVGSFALRSAQVIANAVRGAVGTIYSGSSPMFQAVSSGVRFAGVPISRVVQPIGQITQSVGRAANTVLGKVGDAVTKFWGYIVQNKYWVAFDVSSTVLTSIPYKGTLTGSALLVSSLVTSSMRSVSMYTGVSIYSGLMGQDAFEDYNGYTDAYSQQLIDGNRNITSILYLNPAIAAVDDPTIPAPLIQGAYTTSLLLNLIQAQDQTYKLILFAPAATVDLSYMASALADFSLKYTTQELCKAMETSDDRQNIVNYLADLYFRNAFLEISFEALKAAWITDLQTALGYYRYLMPFVLEQYESIFETYAANLDNQFQYSTYSRLAGAATTALYNSVCLSNASPFE